MGRSQVLRNRTRGRGRGGRGGGGREGGAGRGGSLSNTSRRHKGGMDPSKLGDNSFRYERNNNSNNVASDDKGGGGRYDGLLDDINFMSSGVGGVGEYYGDSHYAPNDNGEEDLVDAILLSSATAALSLSSEKSNEKRDMNHQQQNKDKTVVENWMTIDIKALDKCMKQIPIHERLKLPRHVGRHLEDMYGVGTPSSGGGEGGGARKKTLAQLREESKCIASKEEEEESKIESSNEELQSSESDALPQNDSEKVEDKIPDGRDADNNAIDDDEEEEDLDAWLDDMIA